MFNKNRFPFLLLGIGIGILLTNFLYTLNPILEYREYTEEEIIEKATELGMVFLKENIDIVSEKDNTIEQNSKEVITNKEVKFVIEKGDSLEKISRSLEDEGIIDDKNKFLKYAKNKGVDKKLRIGTYQLISGSDYDTILSILMKIESD